MGQVTTRVRVDENQHHCYICADTHQTLPVTINHVGHHRISSHSYSWYGLQRGDGPTALIQYTLQGRGGLEFRGQSYAVKPGQAMLLTIPEDHHYFLPDDSNYYEVIYLGLGGKVAVEMFQKLRDQFGVVVDLALSSPPLLALNQILDAPELSPYELSAQAYNFLMLLAQELDKSQNPAKQPAWVEESLNFCRRHLHENLSVEVLAAQCHLSRAHFSREIKKYLGQAPGELLRTMRMKYALELLQNSPLSVKEIAAACGFADASYFIKVFSRYHHFTPGARHHSGGAY